MSSKHVCSWDAIVGAADRNESPEGVAECASCAAMLASLQAVRASFAEWRGFERGDPAAQEALLRRVRTALAARGAGEASDVLGAWRERVAAAGQRVLEVWAELTADSWGPRTALAAVRSTASGTRFLQYATDAYTIAVALEGDPREPSGVRGQLVPRLDDHIADGALASWRRGDDARVCPLSEFGEFQFDGVALDGAEVCVAVGSTVIHVPSVTDA